MNCLQRTNNLSFISPQPLFRIFTSSLPSSSSLHRHSSICMKNTSSSDKSSKKKRAKNNFSSKTQSTGTGFGSAKSSQTASNNETATLDNPPASSSTPDDDKIVDEASGAAGDATPHRVNVQKKPTERLRDPTEELNEPAPLVALPILSKEELQQYRFDLDSTNDQLLEYFQDASHRDDFPSVLVSNRHHITEALLYRFTSIILRAESDGNESEEEINNMKKLRKNLVAFSWSFDFSFKRAVQSAEARLVNVLKSSNIKREMKANCGRSTLEVNAFWTVIYAAVIAWEERGQLDPEAVNEETQTILKEAAENCKQLDSVVDLLSPCLNAIQNILTQLNPEKQIEIVNDLNDEDVLELINLSEAISLLPAQAYGGLAERLRVIINYIRSSKYGLQTLKFEPVRFTPKEIIRDSKIVEFARRNQSSNNKI